ncbi:MAG: dienelactone hydrolase family protein [Pseudonocardiales bacterium]|nr:dienelactone hydrolase family protein [Pseudonocardiales bacterium]MBV9029765.1 dienelactone hydrolase family protein [Pseudonocardiales bacterium]MBW0009196.1 dienelactone hydrolase family protein [Pseudonocardiales bacterium]
MSQRSLERIPLSDGTRLRLSVATPESAVCGGIVVGPQARGVTDAVWRLAAGLAGEGWLAVIPHLHHRDGIDELPEDGSVGRYVERLTAQSLQADTDAAFDWLARHGVSGDRIGVVGFELGGTVALIVATQRDLGAAVTIGGIGVVASVAATLPALVDIAPELRCPWLGIYGHDGEVPEEEVHKLRDAAYSAQVATDLVHCHFDTDQSVAPEAWARTLNWFGSHLR